MARILYSIAGEGFGHAIRSKVILDSLVKRNKILIFGGGNTYKYTSKYYDIKKIYSFRFVYKNNSVNIVKTFLYNLLLSPVMLFYFLKLSYQILKFKPNIIITDFEPLSSYAALFFRIPCINMSYPFLNTRFLSAYKIVTNKKSYLDYLMAKIVVTLFSPLPDLYITPTFFHEDFKDKKTIITKPIIRKQILSTKTKNHNHILVYQTSKSNKKLIKELQKIDEKFIVYGVNHNKRLGNVILKDISEKEFLDDLKSCKAVITNGGFTLMSEALCLKKPILSIPIKKQFEQILNAVYLERLGYGIFARDTNKKIIERFIRQIPTFRKKLKNYKKYSNDEAIRKINDAVKSLS